MPARLIGCPFRVRTAATGPGQSTPPQDGWHGLPAAPPQRPHPGDQLSERERLAQVVVGTEPEALDPVGDVGRRGQHQHPHARPGGDEFLAQLVAVHPGEVAIEDDHVVVIDADPLLPGEAVVGDVDRHPLAAQADPYVIGQPLLVLDDQDSHARLTFL